MRRCLALVCLLSSAFVPALVSAQDQSNESGRVVVTRVAPVYPDLARSLNLEGIVKVRVTVAPDGTVKVTQILGGNPLLAKSAQDAISRWKWAPSPHESIETVQLRFHPPNRP